MPEGGFREVFIFPAAEDSGAAVGTAFYGLWQMTGMGKNTCRRLSRDTMGKTYTDDEIDRAIDTTPGLAVSKEADVAGQVARLLCDGGIVGWFWGRSELGPRSLGQRSILCDPRRSDAQQVLNARVKHREAFRPFAPVVLREYAEEWFEVPARQAESPFML